MSTIQDKQGPWSSLAGQQLDPKYEKCRNITEEIYKRINITFQIKKLESGDQSDISDISEQIDSNELSNETDLFACDKSDISSSTGGEGGAPPPPPPPPLINNNNNEERKAVLYKRPKKRFRKRVKKRGARRRSDSEGSSDEAPLARALLPLATEPKTRTSEKVVTKKPPTNNLTLRDLLRPDDIKIPTVIIEKIRHRESPKTTDNAEKNRNTDKTFDEVTSESYSKTSKEVGESLRTVKPEIDVSIENRKVLSVVEDRKRFSKDVKVTDWKSCSLCHLSFRGARGLRRHMSMSHVESPESNK